MTSHLLDPFRLIVRAALRSLVPPGATAQGMCSRDERVVERRRERAPYLPLGRHPRPRTPEQRDEAMAEFEMRGPAAEARRVEAIRDMRRRRGQEPPRFSARAIEKVLAREAAERRHQPGAVFVEVTEGGYEYSDLIHTATGRIYREMPRVPRYAPRS